MVQTNMEKGLPLSATNVQDSLDQTTKSSHILDQRNDGSKVDIRNSIVSNQDIVQKKRKSSFKDHVKANFSSSSSSSTSLTVITSSSLSSKKGSDQELAEHASTEDDTNLEDLLRHSDSTRSGEKPRISYAAMITEAIQSSPQGMLVLSDIYEWIMEHYPYYQTAGGGWKNSIRHNLSLSKQFCKVPRIDQSKGTIKGNFWKISTALEMEQMEHDRMIKRRSASLPTGSRLDDIMYPILYQPNGPLMYGAGNSKVLFNPKYYHSQHSLLNPIGSENSAGLVPIFQQPILLKPNNLYDGYHHDPKVSSKKRSKSMSEDHIHSGTKQELWSAAGETSLRTLLPKPVSINVMQSSPYFPSFNDNQIIDLTNNPTLSVPLTNQHSQDSSNPVSTQEARSSQAGAISSFNNALSTFDFQSDNYLPQLCQKDDAVREKDSPTTMYYPDFMMALNQPKTNFTTHNASISTSPLLSQRPLILSHDVWIGSQPSGLKSNSATETKEPTAAGLTYMSISNLSPILTTVDTKPSVDSKNINHAIMNGLEMKLDVGTKRQVPQQELLLSHPMLPTPEPSNRTPPSSMFAPISPLF